MPTKKPIGSSFEDDEIVKSIEKQNKDKREEFRKKFMETNNNIKELKKKREENKKKLEALRAAKAVKTTPTKSNTQKDIKDLIKDIKKDITKKNIKKMIEKVSNTPIKESKKSKTLNKAVNLGFEMLSHPKGKKYNDIEGVDDTIKEVSKLLKAKPSQLKKLVKADKEHIKYHPSEQDKKELKMDKKVMQLAKGYSHKADNLSDAARDYVDRYISIYQNNPSPPARGRKINDLKLNVFTKLRPSDADDASSLIRDFLKTLEKPVKAKKAPVVLSEDIKKEKQIKNYIKTKIKQGFFPTLKDDEENINYIVQEALNKGFTRCSVDFVESMLNEN